MKKDALSLVFEELGKELVQEAELKAEALASELGRGLLRAALKAGDKFVNGSPRSKGSKKNDLSRR